MYNVDDMSKFNINPQTGELTPKNAQTVNLFSAFIGGTDSNIGRLEKVESVEGMLSLKEGDYYTEIADGSVIELPEVKEFAKVTLWFRCNQDISITFPEVAWQNEPESNAGYIYEYIFTYIPEFETWVGGFVSYEVVI